MFCEMRASSVCAAEKWCSMETLFDPHHKQYLFASQKRWVGTYANPNLTRADIEPKMHVPLLWHGYKWEKSEARTLYAAQLRELGIGAAGETR